jgi:Ser/Thr protein kinase RdoA (MazF antagonist)
VAFSVPESSLGCWAQHLRSHAVETTAPVTRDGEEALALHDPDGLSLELVAHPQPGRVVDLIKTEHPSYAVTRGAAGAVRW